MKELHIRARLHCHNHYNTSRLYRIVRGTTAILTYNWSEKGYDYSRLEQLTFNFKQDDLVTSYTAFDYYRDEDIANRTIDDHFEFVFNPDDQNELLYVTFTFSHEETSALELTAPGNEMQFEVVLRFNVDESEFDSVDNKDAIIVEKQAPIIVVDSLESEGE